MQLRFKFEESMLACLCGGKYAGCFPLLLSTRGSHLSRRQRGGAGQGGERALAIRSSSVLLWGVSVDLICIQLT